VLAPSLPLKQWFPTFFGPWTIFSKNIPCGPLCITRDSRRTTNTKAKDSVVQLLLNYGTIYKNVTTRGPLPIKWCIKQQIRKIQHCKGTVKWVRHWNHYTISINNLLQISSVRCLWLRLLWHYRSFINTSMLEIASRRLCSGVASAIRFLFLGLTCFIVEKVLQTSSAFLARNLSVCEICRSWLICRIPLQFI